MSDLPTTRPARTSMGEHTMRSRARTALAVTLIASLGLAACGGSDKTTTTTTGSTPASGTGGKLSLVAFSVAKTATDAAIAAWQKTPEGAGMKFDESYGASGDQSRAVVSGLPADVVHFSLETDVTRLVKEGLVADDWSSGPTKGIVSDSVVVIAVRPGNPKHITGWDDLVKPGIGVITPNPASSGSARWNVLAAYGHVIANGGTQADAETYLKQFFQNTVALPGSGRDATSAFVAGTGDVLISYENEAILARQQDQKLDYIVPDTTLLIQNPSAVLKTADPKAADWLKFETGVAGQTEFAKVGFRPVAAGVKVDVTGANDPANPFPTPAKLLTIDKDFGGWAAAATKYFDADNGIVSKIQKDTGKT